MESGKKYSRSEYYQRLYRIRYFEESLLTLFSQDKLKGTTHPCIGQEATAVALMEHIQDMDCVFSNHRCHGHFIEYSGKPELLLAEIMGKENGVCRGRGGSQHLMYRNFYSNGIQGGFTPNAAGMAFAEKYRQSGGIVISFLGDGTLGQGVVYESLNMASLYSLPILYVIEDNGYAMSTRTEDAVAGSIAQRMMGFGIETGEITSNDVEELSGTFQAAIDFVRSQVRPFCQIIHTYRLGPHSKGDDTRDPGEIESHRPNDPLVIMEKRLNETVVKQIQADVQREIQEMIQRCSQLPCEDDVSVCKVEMDSDGKSDALLNSEPGIKCFAALNEGLRMMMQTDKRVVIMGEDIREPYNGPFKVTKGLSDEFGDRVLNMPISEAGFTGMAIGMAMRGLHPVVDFMFGDFITLGLDQILNHAAKYNWMYAKQVSVPVLIRVPMGGERSYGATHSQTLEKHFIGIPGIRILAASLLIDSRQLLKTINDNIREPTLLIENKRMYAQRQYVVKNGRLDDFAVTAAPGLYPSVRLTYEEDTVADGVVITYGGYVDRAVRVARRLMVEDEIMIDIVAVTQIAPLEFDRLAELVKDIPRIITLEEGTRFAGWGAEIIAEFAERGIGREYLRIGAKDCPLPVNDKLEKKILPSEDEVYNAIRRMVK